MAWAEKPTVPGRSANDNVGLEAVLYLDPAEVTQRLGQELPEGFVLVEITLTPKNGQTVKVDRDDFQIISSRDGQRSQPFAPTQIAGADSLMVVTRNGGGRTMAEQRRAPWGGIGGQRPMGMPTPGGSIGNARVTDEQAAASEVQGDAKKLNPLLTALRDKILPEKEITEPMTGQLYFLFEGKLKAKDLEMFYKAPGGRLSVRFVR
jgi:hypothetical protein